MSTTTTIPPENDNYIKIKLEPETAGTTTTVAPLDVYEVTPTSPPEDEHSYGSNTPNQPGGIPQHRFFGASVTSFSMTAGFGDDVSTLSVELVEDTLGGDVFIQPIVGQPAFFTFGDQIRDTSTGFSKAIADLIGGSSSNNGFSFGGIVQSWNKTTDASSGKQYTVNLVDPR